MSHINVLLYINVSPEFLLYYNIPNCDMRCKVFAMTVTCVMSSILVSKCFNLRVQSLMRSRRLPPRDLDTCLMDWYGYSSWVEGRLIKVNLIIFPSQQVHVYMCMYTYVANEVHIHGHIQYICTAASTYWPGTGNYHIRCYLSVVRSVW